MAVFRLARRSGDRRNFVAMAEIDMRPARVSLEAFLDEHDFCLRSFAEEKTPLFEMQYGYDSEHADVLRALEGEELDGQLIGMFEGWGEDLLSRGVPCVITDSRSETNCQRTVLLKPRMEMKGRGSVEGGSSEDSEPVVPVEEDFEGDGLKAHG
jgi:hypothetical protein